MLATELHVESFTTFSHKHNIQYTCECTCMDILCIPLSYRMDLIPFYARLVATLHPCLEDVATILVEILIKDLRFQIKKKDQVHIHSKLKNVRFIGTNVHTHVFLYLTTNIAHV